jgi:hypothetical protein
MKKYKLKLNPVMMQGLADLLEFITMNALDISVTDADKLWVATLVELKIKLDTKMCTPTAKYTVNLTPAQAFALRIVQVNHVQDVTSYLGNKLHQVSMEVNKFYQ